MADGGSVVVCVQYFDLFSQSRFPLYHKRGYIGLLDWKWKTFERLCPDKENIVDYSDWPTWRGFQQKRINIIIYLEMAGSIIVIGPN